VWPLLDGRRSVSVYLNSGMSADEALERLRGSLRRDHQ
jgi:hypothetical protein